MDIQSQFLGQESPGRISASDNHSEKFWVRFSLRCSSLTKLVSERNPESPEILPETSFQFKTQIGVISKLFCSGQKFPVFVHS